MAGKTVNVLSAATSMVWAILPEKLDAILDVLEMRAAGLQFTDEEIRARVGDGMRGGPAPRNAGSVAVLPLHGVIAQRMNMMTDMSGGTSTEQFAAAFEAAVNNPDVSAIVLDVDSPGGSTSGVPELAALVRSARGKKPIYAVANSMMASAAVWIGAQADRIFATPSALVGSIGAMLVHTDMSEANAKAGVKRTYITSEEFKAEANEDQPLTDEAHAALKALVNEHGAMFVRDVAKARGIAPAAVRANYGGGRIMSAKQAREAGLVDDIATLDEVIASLSKGRGGGGKMRAVADPPPLGNTTITLPIAATATGGDSVSGAGFQFTEEATAALLGAGVTVVGWAERPSTSTTAAGGPAAVLHLVPSPSPKEHPVSDTPTAATNGAAPAAELKAVQEALAKAERTERIAELCSLVPGLTAGEVAAYHKSDKSIDMIRAELAARVATPQPINATVGKDRAGDRDFTSLGEQLAAIANYSLGAGLDPRLMRIHAALATGSASANVPSDGAFAIQKDFSINLVKDAFGEGSLAADCSSQEVSGNSDGLEVMYLKETSRATGSRWGGVQVYWGAEGDTATAKKPDFAKWEARLEDIIGLAYVSRRLLQDAAAVGGVFSSAFSAEFAFTVDDAIVRGTGAGRPLGILNSGGLVTVTKETGQVADTVVAENIQKMWARLKPRAQANATWYVNQEVPRQLQNMTIGTGTSAQLVYMPPGGLSGSPYGSIFGRPVKVVEQCSAIGDAGDIILADLSQYQLITKGGLESEVSPHVRFLTNEDTFRWVMRVGGAPRLLSALTPYKGSDTLSDHVTLGAR